MSSNGLIETFCGDQLFWESNLSWNTTDPQFTECFQVVVFNGFPVSLLIFTILTHICREKKLPFDPTKWTFLKWTRLILIMFACLSNLIYSFILTQRYYSIQDRVLLTFTVFQLIKSTCYVSRKF